jgi:Holliday junction DNA helicase RuvB
MKKEKQKNNFEEEESDNIEQLLRPKTFDDYIGQEKVKAHLKLIIDAAKERKEAPDHLLFYGQPGLGKTTLAYIIGREINVNVRSTSGPALEKSGDIAAILSNLEPNEILFIDEIHRLNKNVEEIFYPAMESRKLHIIIGKGPAAKTFTLNLPPFTIIGATTKVNLLSAPLRSRFGAIFKLDYYETEDIEKIIKRSSKILKAKITEGGAKILAQASRFTPRVANRLLKRARDYAQINRIPEINENVAKKTLEMLQIDSLGLEEQDRNLLKTIIEKFNGGPVGIKTLAAALNEEIETIEEIYEPFLMRLGFLKRTPSGRVVTELAYKHLGMENQKNLF